METTKFNIGMMIAVNGRVKVNQNVTAALGKQMTLKQAITHAKQLARGFVSATDFVAVDIFADNHHAATVEAWKDGRAVSFEVHEIAGIIKVDESEPESPTTPDTETAPAFTIEERGIGGCCDKYNIDALQMNGVNIALRFTRWDDASRKYYEIPVSVKNQAAVIAAFAGLDLQEDEPGALLLRGCDDETAAKVGYYAAVLDGELQETTTNTTDNVTTAIANELNARKDKSAWSKAVTAYALELVETLDNWDKQPKSAAELREMMLNGASDWSAYSWGGSSLIYNGDIAERVCTPSELKRVTNKNGLRDMANAREHWLDVQARALYQAANLVCNIANKYLNA